MHRADKVGYLGEELPYVIERFLDFWWYQMTPTSARVAPDQLLSSFQ